MSLTGSSSETAGRTPLVSVLIPAYNHERYVETAVRSVLGQDWPRIELLVIDDGSTDATWDVLQRLRPECERRFERLVLKRQENCGMCETINRLRTLARGEFVAIIASDDAYLPGALRALAEKLMTDPGLVLAVGVNELMDGEGRRCYWDAEQNTVYDEATAVYRTFDEQLEKTIGIAGDHPMWGTYRLLLHCNCVPNGYMVRREALERTGPHVPEVPLEDHWRDLQLAKLGRMAKIPVHTFRYRWHDTNTIKQRDRMIAYSRRTLLHEERTLFAGPDDAHKREYVESNCRRLSSFGGPGLFGVRKYLSPFGAEIVERCLFGRRTYVREGARDGRTLVVVHVFYPERWSELAERIRNIASWRDLVITYVDEAAVREARADFPEAEFLQVENRGWDVWPFLQVIRAADLDKYDRVVKLHTKRDVPVEWCCNDAWLGGRRWRERLLGFLADARAWRRTLRRLADPKVGMVADRQVVFTGNAQSDDAGIYDRAVAEMREATGVAVTGGRYVAGTMFAVKPAALRALLAREFSAGQFEKPVPGENFTYAHVLERMFGVAVSAAGMRVEAFNGSVTFRRLYYDRRSRLGAVVRFFWTWRIKYGELTVKVFKLKVFRRRLFFPQWR